MFRCSISGWPIVNRVHNWYLFFKIGHVTTNVETAVIAIFELFVAYDCLSNFAHCSECVNRRWEIIVSAYNERYFDRSWNVLKRYQRRLSLSIPSLVFFDTSIIELFKLIRKFNFSEMGEHFERAGLELTFVGNFSPVCVFRIIIRYSAWNNKEAHLREPLTSRILMNAFFPIWTK